MLCFCCKIESIFRIIYINLKLLYYKIKYGKRLKIGKRVRFRKGFKIVIDKNARVEIGNNVFFNKDCTIDAFKKIKIGEKNLFGENVKIYDHNHVFNIKGKSRGNNFNGDEIIIGNNNWIGTNVIILSGTLIANNNVIGAGVVGKLKLNDDEIIKVNKEMYTCEKIRYKNKEGFVE